MLLTVSGLPPLTDPNHFYALFGRYVYGFNSWTHCDGCFKARRELKINPKMDASKPVVLKDELFYLCGVGRKLSKKRHPETAQNNTNVHFAVHPRKGSVAAIGSVYGTTFVVEDAQAIPIRVPNREFPALLELKEPYRTAHARCRMFHFAYQMFEVDDISLTPSVPVYKLREEWRAVPGIKKDAAGYMVDPQLAW